jgi:hypothetical protein
LPLYFPLLFYLFLLDYKVSPPGKNRFSLKYVRYHGRNTGEEGDSVPRLSLTGTMVLGIFSSLGLSLKHMISMLFESYALPI